MNGAGWATVEASTIHTLLVWCMVGYTWYELAKRGVEVCKCMIGSEVVWWLCLEVWQ